MARRVTAQTIIRRNEPLAKRTTLRVGGPADFFVEPAGEEDLAAVVKICRERKVAFFILGRGSNLVVKDGGVRGIVIALAQPAFSRVEVDGMRCVAARAQN